MRPPPPAQGLDNIYCKLTCTVRCTVWLYQWFLVHPPIRWQLWQLCRRNSKWKPDCATRERKLLNPPRWYPKKNTLCILSEICTHRIHLKSTKLFWSAIYLPLLKLLNPHFTDFLPKIKRLPFSISSFNFHCNYDCKRIGNYSKLQLCSTTMYNYAPAQMQMQIWMLLHSSPLLWPDANLWLSHFCAAPHPPVQVQAISNVIYYF